MMGVVWSGAWQERARVPRVGLAVVSHQELVTAELNPWRMTDIAVTPLNGHPISKNNRSSSRV
jgi:hypothetical protein